MKFSCNHHDTLEQRKANVLFSGEKTFNLNEPDERVLEPRHSQFGSVIVWAKSKKSGSINSVVYLDFHAPETRP